MDKIRVLLVDDEKELRDRTRSLLVVDKDMAVVGEATDGMDAIQKVIALNPHIVLMDVNMPKLDGISATEKIYLDHPGCAVIVISAPSEQGYLRRAMLAGARDFLVRPFESEELIDTIKRVYQLESKRIVPGKEGNAKQYKPHVVTIFGTKGGVGKTTLAVNLAVMLAATKKKVALDDLDLQFGDVSTFLNITPKMTISELAQEGDHLDIELIESYMIPHISGIKVLPAPGRPEYSELITSANVENILTQLKLNYDYVIIDTPPLFNDCNLTAIEMSSQILLVTSLELATLKNIKLGIELLDSLFQKGKTKLILNKANEENGIKINDAETTLDFRIAAQIPSDLKLAISAVNKGIPFVQSNPTSKVSHAIRFISEMVIKDSGSQVELEKKHKGILARILKKGG